MTTQLQQDIKQRRPFRSLPEETFLNVLRASASLMNGLSELLRPANLTQPQYNVLRILRGAGAVDLGTDDVVALNLMGAPGGANGQGIAYPVHLAGLKRQICRRFGKCFAILT